MNETIISQLNKDLYEDGKVFWLWNRGWTSILWQNLYKRGWKLSQTPAGFKVFTDESGHKIETFCLSFPYALKELAIMMR
jgi:hypothetical protein